LNSLNCAWDGNPVYSAYVKKDRPNLHDKKEKVKANLCVILLILDCIKRWLCIFIWQNSKLWYFYRTL